MGKITSIDLQCVSGTPPKPTGPPENGSAAQAGNRDGAKQTGERRALSDQKYDGAEHPSTSTKPDQRKKATLQQKIARKFAGETPAQRADHLEIARRYAWSDDDRANVHRIPKIRLRELERLFAWRWGPTLPDDDCGRECLAVALDQIVQFGNPFKHIHAWVALWAPWLTSDELVILINNAINRRKRWRAGLLGREVRLTEEERMTLRITTFRPYNVTKAGLAKRARSRKRATDTARRRAAGAVSRADYEANSAARNKPWEALGISRSTWHRRGKPMPADDVEIVTANVRSDESQPQPVRQVRETSPRGAEERYGERLLVSRLGDEPFPQSPAWLNSTDPPPLLQPGTRLVRAPATGLSSNVRIGGQLP